MNVGVDLVAVDRLQRAVERTPGLVQRVFTDIEVADATRDGVALTSAVAASRLAARFAAKEAARKALREPLSWRDVEVRTAGDGAPALWLRGAPAEASVSLAHDAGIALAFVVTGS